MKPWGILYRTVVFIILAMSIGFDLLLYNFCEKQKAQLNSIEDKQDVEAEFSSNKFKFEQDQIERISKDLEDARRQIKDQKDAFAAQNDVLVAQKDALLQEVEKRQQVENEGKGIQTSLVDIKAETDAIKQDMKGWQKDYVSVLAELEKKMDDSQAEVKKSINSLKAELEKNPQPLDNTLTNASQ